MLTLKTEVSELSVAFGILGVKPINPVLSEEEISAKFENTLPYNKYIKYCESDLCKRKGTAMFELVEVKTGRIIERYDYDFDEFIKTKYGGFFSLITDDVFTPGDVRPEFAWRRSKTTELVNIP